MNFDQANEWLHNKTLRIDLEVVVDASRKWKGRKLVTHSANASIPSVCKTGHDLIQFITIYKTLIELQIERTLDGLPKHVQLIQEFLKACSDKKSILKSNNELRKVFVFEQTARKKFEKQELLFKKYDAILEVWQGIFDDNYSAETLINDDSRKKYSFSYDLIENFVYTAPVKLDHKKNKEPVKIIFTPDEIKLLQKLILDISQIDFVNVLNKIFTITTQTFKNFDKYITHICKDYESFENKDDESDLIYRLLKNVLGPDDFIENEYGYFNMYFQTDVMRFITLIKETVKLMERTDGWLSSKNV